MEGNRKRQPNKPVETQTETEEFDQQNLLAFFALLLQVDKRLNPKKYEFKTDD